MRKGFKIADIDKDSNGDLGKLDVPLPKGSVVIVDIYGVHRNRPYNSSSIPS